MTDIESGTNQLSAFGSTAEEQIKNVIAQKPVVMFGRSACPFTIEAAETFKRLSIPATEFYMDKMPKSESPAVYDALRKEYTQTTVPYIMVNGEFVGGCDDMKAQLASGVLMPKLYKIMAGNTATEKNTSSSYADAFGADAKDKDSAHATEDHDVPYIPGHGDLRDPYLAIGVAKDTTPVYRCLFWYPELNDGVVARGIAFLTALICIISIIWREHAWAHWLMLALFIDATLRLLFGGGPSALGQLSRVMLSPIEPHFVPGFPKQFAAFAATMLSGLSALFFLLSFDDEKNITACVIAAMLMCFAILESVFNWCAGCWMFGLGVTYGLLPKTMYTIATNSKPEATYAYNDATKKVPLMPTERITKQAPGGYPATDIDFTYKTKNDDNERQEFDIIKHTKIAHFTMSLGLVGLAVVWKVAADPKMGLHISEQVSEVFQYISIIVFLFQVICYAVKAFLYFPKVRKEWQCPMRSNSFAVPPLILMLFAYCIYDNEFDHSLKLAKAIFWIGAVLAMVLAIKFVGTWISDRKCFDHMFNSWIIPPVGLFVAALVGPYLDADYTEAMYLWFSFAAIVWFMLMPVLFYKQVVFLEADDRVRPSVFVWVAPPAIAFPAYLALTGATELDFISRTLYFSGLAVMLVLGYLFCTGYLSRCKFDVAGSWSYVFPIDAMAIATIIWAGFVPGDWPYGMAMTALIIANLAAFICLFQTLATLALGGMFVSDGKYGPLSQQKLTHEAFRGAIPKLLASCKGLDPDSDAGRADFIQQFKLFHLAHSWHAYQEDEVLFKNFDDFMPGITTHSREDHAQDHELLNTWAGMVVELEQGKAAGARAGEIISTFQKELPAYCVHLEEHLVEEEVHLQPIPKKYIPIEVQKQMLRDIWALTPASVWEAYMPWIVNNLPLMGMRVKFIRCWLWAMPERAQQIGRWIALNSDAVAWERLRDYCPELAPRGDPHHVRYG